MSATLYQNLINTAERLPDHLAYKCADATLSYTELNDISDRLACWLVDHGLKEGERVGIFMSRCIESPIAVYGILKAGGVFVPMDPNAPSSRNEYVVRQVRMKFIVGHNQVRFHFRKLDIASSSVQEVLGFPASGGKDWSWDMIRSYPKRALEIQMEPEDLAYIMFTSGSTGTPKGIMHTHKSGGAYARLSKALYDVSETDTIANHSPLHFDISTFGYFTSVLAGATTVLCTDAHVKLPASLAELITKEKITIWYSVPLALIQILEAEVLDLQNWGALRWILFGGEPFPLPRIEAISPYVPNATWCNVYGPAEVNQCSYYHFKGVDPTWSQVPLGYIWDETDHLIVEDELLIASTTQMKGYWEEDERSQKAFFHQNGKRYYRTGDIVSLNDGLLYFHGRKDRQAKIRGYRVELEEIEHHIRVTNLVEDVSVFAVKKSDASKMIVAAIQGKEEEEKIGNIRKAMKLEIPSYAQPEVYFFIQSIPRTTAGKVDYNKLVEIAERII